MSVKKLQSLLKKAVIKLDSEELVEFDQDCVNEVCKQGIAYKLKSNELIGKKYLSDKILIAAKEQESQNTHFKLGDTLISPFIVFEILEELESQNLLIKEKDKFIVNIKHILSPDNVKNFCQYRIDEITLEDVLCAFGFKSDFYKNYGFDKISILTRSEARSHCEGVLEGLVRDGVLLASDKSLTFFWNFKR